MLAASDTTVHTYKKENVDLNYNTVCLKKQQSFDLNNFESVQIFLET